MKIQTFKTVQDRPVEDVVITESGAMPLNYQPPPILKVG